MLLTQPGTYWQKQHNGLHLASKSRDMGSIPSVTVKHDCIPLAFGVEGCWFNPVCDSTTKWYDTGFENRRLWVQARHNGMRLIFKVVGLNPSVTSQPMTWQWLSKSSVMGSTSSVKPPAFKVEGYGFNLRLIFAENMFTLWKFCNLTLFSASKNSLLRGYTSLNKKRRILIR